MNCTKTIAGILTGVAAVFSAEASVDLYETFKDQTFTGEYSGLSQNETYTLSQDYKFQKEDGTAVSLRYQAGDVFDFSDGNHTLTCAGTRASGGVTGKTVAFKGGIWNMAGTGSFFFGGWSNLDYSDWTWTLEDVVVTNTSSSATFFSGYGTNRRAFLKRSIIYGGSNYNDFSTTSATRSNSGLMEFAEGSKFVSRVSTFLNRNTESTNPQNFTLRFTGKGSGFVRYPSTAANDFALGNKAPGECVEVLDEATFDTRWLHVGNHANGDSNVFYVVDGAVTCVNDTSIGKVDGSEFNELVVAGPKGSFDNGASSILVGNAGSFNTLTISNGAEVACRSVILANSSESGTSSNNVVRILDGGVAKLTNELKVGLSATGGGNNRVEIDGGTLQSNSKILLGEGAPGNSIVLSNGGLLKATSSLEYRTGGNSVDICSGATVEVSSVSMDINANSDGNRLRLLGGTLTTTTATAYLYIGNTNSKDDELVVSNGVLAVKTIRIGDAVGSNGNRVYVHGSNTVLDTEFERKNVMWQVFGKGRENLLEIADHAEVRAWRFYFGDGSTNNTVRVTRGAKLNVDEYCWIASSDTSTKALNNVFEISDGAVLTTSGDLRTSGGGNTILVDDAIVRSSGTFATFFTGKGKVRLCGTHPLMTTFDNDAAHLEFRDQTELTYALPTNGAVYAQAPLQAAVGVNFHDTAMIRFENLEAFRSNLTQRVDVPLALTFGEGNVKNGVSDNLLAKVNAALVEQGCPWAQVRNSADKKLTFLHVKPEVGLLLIVR